MANFTEDSRAENWLKMRGVKFDYKSGLRFGDLIPSWFSVNQGRPDGTPKSDALIEKYASAMNQGSVFPSPIIAQTAGGYEVLDGCQRLCAAELCGQSLFNAYIIKTHDPSIRASVRICANSVLNGTAPSQDWTVSKIVDVLFEQFNFSAVDCSQWSGQPVQKIETEIASRDMARWLRCQKVDTTLKPANQKGFLAAAAKLAPLSLRQHLTRELPEVVRQLQSVKANNDEAVHLLTEILSIERKKGVDPAQQVASKCQEVMSRPEIRERMSGPRSLHPIDNCLAGMAATITKLRSAAKDDQHTDKDQSRRMVELLVELRRLVKKVIPKDHWEVLVDQIPTERVAVGA